MPHHYTVTDQVKFLSGWFDNWSELQRDDFLPILAQSVDPVNHVNGLVENVPAPHSFSGRRPSLFDCQVKLFHDWYDAWSEEEKQRFLEHVTQSDPDFVARLAKLKEVIPAEVEADNDEPEAAPALPVEVPDNPEDDVDDGVAAGSNSSSSLSSLTPSQSNNDSGLDENNSDGEVIPEHAEDPHVQQQGQGAVAVSEEAEAQPKLPASDEGKNGHM